jgi:Tfp pilus assembly protein PilV
VNAAAVIDLRGRRPSRLAARFGNEHGIGLIELLIALLVLNIGIFATLGAFTSAATTIRRASRISTAAAIADKKMEAFRNTAYTSFTAAAVPLPGTLVAGADGNSYTYTASVASGQVTGGSSFVKQVTINIYQGAPGSGGRLLATSTSTFSRCTQAGVGSDPASSACQN